MASWERERGFDIALEGIVRRFVIDYHTHYLVLRDFFASYCGHDYYPDRLSYVFCCCMRCESEQSIGDAHQA
jgi:hypothetical protein